MYMQLVANNAKTFAPVKAASTAIAFYQKINLFSHEPTQSPAVCIVREAAIRRFWLKPKNRKNPSSGRKWSSLRIPTGPYSRVIATWWW